jgi:hypothetical protein
MKIEDCVLTGDVVVGAPFTRTEPEEEWVRVRDSGTIPLALFDLIAERITFRLAASPSFLPTPSTSSLAISACSCEARWSPLLIPENSYSHS